MILRPLPPEFATTRDALHQIAFFALAPARYQAVGRMGLQAAPGGFGTPRFEGRVIRVEGVSIVHEERDQVATQTISTIRSAARFAGVEYRADWFEGFHDPPTPMDPDAELDLDDGAARALGQWFDFGFDVLREFVDRADPEDQPAEIQLWPEHFDPATEVGVEPRRASYGASPGDAAHREPYLYVAAWGEIDRSNPYWNDEAFNGASLSYGALVASEDPNATAIEYLVEGYRAVHTG